MGTDRGFRVGSGIEIGLELGFDHGRMSAIVETEAKDASGPAATALVARLADLLGDTDAGHQDVLLALLAALRATVIARHETQQSVKSMTAGGGP
ncbi:MAG: hypothetical protein AAGF11_16715 [Myxococcota bacterium]